MSDMMQGQMPQNPMAKPNAITNNLSALNGADLNMMKQTGAINKNMTVKDWVEKVLRVPLEAPVSALIPALKAQTQNRNMMGKTQSIAAQAAPQGAGPQAPPQMPPSPQGGGQGGGGLEALMSQMKGR